MTDFSSVRIAGVPVYGGNGMLPLMGGNIAATGEQKNYFVDPANATGNGGDGLFPSSALNQVSAAEDRCRDLSGDTVYLLNDGNTSGTSREDNTAGIIWDKDNVHLVGLCAPGVNQRSRISPSSDTIAVTPQLTVSGNGCIFKNFALVEGNTTTADSTGLAVSGLRNYFEDVSVLNMLGDTSNDARTRVGSECILLSGAENTFRHCTIGTDTVQRVLGNANVRTAASATRNRFEDCLFPMRTSADSPLFLDVPDGTLDRWLLFLRCMFINAVESESTELATAFVISATAGGMVILQDSYVAGAVEWDVAVSGKVYAGQATSTVSGVTAGGVMDALTT